MKKEIGVLIIVNLLSVPLSLMSPYFVKYLIDYVFFNGKVEAFLIVVVGMLGAYLLRFIIDLIKLYCSNKMGNRFTYRIRQDIWKKYVKIPYQDFENFETGDLKMRLYDDVVSLGNFVSDQVVGYIFNILVVIISLSVSFFVNYKLTLICLFIVPMIFLVNMLIGIGVKKTNEKFRSIYKEYYSFEHNSLQFWKEIKSQNAQSSFIAKFKEYRKILAKLGYTQIKYWFFSEVFTDLKANYFSKILIFIAGATLIFNGQITMGTLVMLSDYFGAAVTALDEINSKNVALKTNQLYYRKIFEVLNFEEEEKKDAINLSGDIEFNAVSFRYKQGGTDIIHNECLKIRAGETVSITGRSGGGKSTLIKLLLNLYPSDKGVIALDGIDVSKLSKICIYSQMGIVMQDAYLFNTSIKNNLLMANKNATETMMTELCKDLNLYDFIMSLPHGFDTIVGEKGIKLSGGQKQRLLIAQALLKSPQILILDEATSSMDRLSEDIVCKRIFSMENMTVVMISHNPYVLSRSDNIIVI